MSPSDSTTSVAASFLLEAFFKISKLGELQCCPQQIRRQLEQVGLVGCVPLGLFFVVLFGVILQIKLHLKVCWKESEQAVIIK